MANRRDLLQRYTFHLIANAHLDPVWLWDWREGLNEGITTCRTVLDLMDEDKDLTFIRGEAAVYEHIERYDPETFKRIRKQVKAGRWDVVGGTWIQPDTNLPATETFCRHFLRGQRYFRTKFGKPVTAAWAADSFGHSAGLPEVLAGAGIESFAFTRPTDQILPIPEPAFWWRGPAGSEILAYRPMVGWYGSDRDEVPSRLDAYLAAAGGHTLSNVGCFYGLGNHGGGATRRMLADIRRWAAGHPEVKVVHSGLHRFFASLRAEISGHGRDVLPTHEGELNFLFRGCYSSVAKFKFAFRGSESLLSSAESTAAAVAALTKDKMPGLAGTWDTLLFNSFHDILPGTSIERALDEQMAQLGGVQHAAHSLHLAAINSLASRIDTSVPPVKGDQPTAVPILVFNPLPREIRGYIELEAALDYRPLAKYTNNGKVDEVPVQVRDSGGRPVTFQLVSTEHSAMKAMAWRKRAVAAVALPPLGWSVMTIAYEEGAKPKRVTGETAMSPGTGVIRNSFYLVRAHARGAGIEILRKGKPLLAGSGLSVVTVEDRWGSWGAMDEDPASIRLKKVRHKWHVSETEVQESGPHRAALFVRLIGGNSRLDLTLSLYKDRDAIDVSARLFVDERSARVKLVFPGAGERATFDVPGGRVVRDVDGEVPGGRWVRASGSQGKIGFASDALYNFDLSDGDFRATICRATRYANDSVQGPEAEPWRPVVDAGELKFRFIVSGKDEGIAAMAGELEWPPITQIVPPARRALPRAGSIAELLPPSLLMTALKPAEDGNGFVLRVQETSGKRTLPRFRWMGRRMNLGSVESNAIATWRLVR
ncbi:MAG TPA: glycoside hydrolase family 38 C-terminal domain-containing protein, partial [Tepidisphaeraceae bacterium]